MSKIWTRIPAGQHMPAYPVFYHFSSDQIISFCRYTISCEKSSENVKCSCRSPPRNSGSPSENDSGGLIMREIPQESEIDLTVKGTLPPRQPQITSLFHHFSTTTRAELSPFLSKDEPLDVTLNSNKNN